MDINTYYGPEDPSTLTTERYFLAGGFICGVGYGVQLVLYATCGLYLCSLRKTKQKPLYLLGYITALLIVETIFIVVQANTVQLMYVDNRNYPGGPWQFFLEHQDLTVNVMSITALFLLTFLADILVLWRCWVIWRATGTALSAYLITSFPCLLLLASFALGVLWILQSSQPSLSLYSAHSLAFGTSYYSISLSVNILLTILIIVRLLIYRKKVMQILPAEHTKQYLSIATIIVESASLYSVFALIFLVTYAVGHPVNGVFMVTASASQQIATYLIIYRVADGRAWNVRSTATLSPMSFDEWANNGKRNQDEGQEFFTTRLSIIDECSTAPTVDAGQSGDYDKRAIDDAAKKFTKEGETILVLRPSIANAFVGLWHQSE